jgi:hypothetical protein
MTEHPEAGRHAPAPDFTAYLANDLQHRMRHQARFGRRGFRPGGVAKLTAMAASIVVTLGIGLIWGVGTGLAAAQIQDGTKRAEPLPLAMMRTTPVRKAISALSCNVPAAVTGAPQGVPIVELPAAPVKTPSTLGAILGIREVSGGKVLVNDVPRRQLKLLDSTLASTTIVFDSIPGSETSYGLRPLPLVAYLGDSSLTADASAGTLLMLGPSGQIVRAIASPYVQTAPPFANLATMMPQHTAVDNKGRIVFPGYPDALRQGTTVEERVANIDKQYVPLLRSDMETRRTDTVTTLKRGGMTALMGRLNNEGPVRITSMPVDIIDLFAVLSDGTVGVVRGQDYHVDWFLPDGTKRSTPKLPFDWKPMTDADKQRLIDSVTAVTATRTMTIRDPNEGGSSTGGGRAFAPPGSAPQGRQIPQQYVPPALNQLPDFYPSIRQGAALADMDGNLWILPNSSAQSRNGELVYDVVNPKGDFHRVRVPVGRSIAGFGKGGVVFLQSGDRATGFYLERTRLPAAARSAP